MDSNLTADSILHSTLHDRQRRHERDVQKVTQQEARRYGMAEKQPKGRIKYTYAGHVFIYDPKSNRAISSWKIDDKRENQGGKKKKKEYASGTRFEKPILIKKSEDHDLPDVKASHDSVTKIIRGQKEKWKSHTVIVVDISGSMREDDVDGARCRADGVFTVLAKDYVKHQLEEQTCSLYDLVSVVVFNEKAKVIIDTEPTDWILYNKLVDFREWSNIRPSGHGFYMPAIDKAKELLDRNNHGSCHLSLLFFSDGKPSDSMHDNDGEFSWRKYSESLKTIVEYTGKLASKFGRRLNISFIGMGDPEEKFTTLRDMSVESKSFSCVSSFNRPSLDTCSLSQIVSSSIASSLSSKSELTSLKTGKARAVRTDIERERINEADGKRPDKNWMIFPLSDSTNYVDSVWTWRGSDFAKVIDPRCWNCFKTVANETYDIKQKAGTICNHCQACYFCKKCSKGSSFDDHRNRVCSTLAQERRSGFLTTKNCPFSFGVAWKQLAFGEGAERLAFKFRFIDEEGKFVGPKMVAKESRFVEDLEEKQSEDYLQSNRFLYHQSFMRTQRTASKFASLFNDSLEKEVPKSDRQRLVKIEFLVPTIFTLQKEEKAYHILVEPMIEGKYEKFTDNYGNLNRDVEEDHTLPEDCGIDISEAASLLGRKEDELRSKSATNAVIDTLTGIVQNETRFRSDFLGAIAEEDEEDSESSITEDEDYDQSNRELYDRTESQSFSLDSVSAKDYLHAFSHFTYVRSGGRFMVVDLQGSFAVKNGKGMYVLTDPALHHNERKYKESAVKHFKGYRSQFGRTDRGRKGMKAFFATHDCNGLCRLFKFRDQKKARWVQGKDN